MSWIDEFGAEYAVPAEITAKVESGAWVDNSWHNDVSPSFDSHETGRRIWVEHPDPDLREWENPRYAVFALNEYHEHASDDTIYHGDDLAEAMRAMEAR